MTSYEILNHQVPPPPSYPLSSIRPLEAAIASRCLQELVCGGNTESVLRSMTSFQKAAATVSCQSCSQSLSKLILKQCAERQQTVLFSFCSWNVQKQRLFPTPTSAGGRGGGARPRIRLIWFTSELCNMPYRTQPTDYVWAFAPPTVCRFLTGYGLRPTQKKNKSIHSDVVLPPINRPRLSRQRLWNPPKSAMTTFSCHGQGLMMMMITQPAWAIITRPKLYVKHKSQTIWFLLDKAWLKMHVQTRTFFFYAWVRKCYATCNSFCLLWRINFFLTRPSF